MKAYIYAGGSIYPENITEHPKSGDLRIAADSGYNNASLLGDRIDILIGDMDSAGLINPPEGVEVITLNPEKDLTDTQAAVEVAIERGANEIVIIGGFGTRLDHTLSTLFILEDMNKRGVFCTVTNGKNRARLIKNTSLLVARSGYRYLSLICADETAKGVDIEGCKYPLKNAVIKRGFQFAVSNEIEGNCALVSVKKGTLFVIESRD